LNIRTHAGIDAALCGTPVTVAHGHAVVELATQAAMAADASGLVHGGFVFGLADHAAMLAVNEPTVVLAAAEVRFLAPVRIGDRLRAEAKVTEATPPKHTVHCVVTNGGVAVFEGDFDCRVPRRHVLAPGQA
jgi:acyl-coenzyme A thioesterase PaaI-like protein